MHFKLSRPSVLQPKPIISDSGELITFLHFRKINKFEIPKKPTISVLCNNPPEVVGQGVRSGGNERKKEN